MPKGVSWTEPEGGLFLWVVMPENIDSEKMLETAIKNNVAYVMGSAFYPDGSGKNTVTGSAFDVLRVQLFRHLHNSGLGRH